MFSILWDNDGILVKTEGLYFQATQSVLSLVGIDILEQQFIEISLRRGESMLQLAEEKGLPPLKIATLRAERNRLYSELLRTNECVIDGVHEAIARLHQHVRMGVVTSSRREHFEIAHEKSGLLRFFDFVITREDYEQSKPHPEPYLTALKQHNLQRKECIVIEDSERGLAAANAARLRCIVIPDEWTNHGNFVGAFKVLQRVSDVPDEIFRLCQSHNES